MTHNNQTLNIIENSEWMLKRKKKQTKLKPIWTADVEKKNEKVKIRAKKRRKYKNRNGWNNKCWNQITKDFFQIFIYDKDNSFNQIDFKWKKSLTIIIRWRL